MPFTNGPQGRLIRLTNNDCIIQKSVLNHLSVDIAHGDPKSPKIDNNKLVDCAIFVSSAGRAEITNNNILGFITVAAQGLNPYISGNTKLSY